jgi:hypothetical protein
MVSRAYFMNTLIDLNGTQDKDFNFNNCSKYKLPCFTLKDYKIYICPFSAHLNIFKNKFNIDIPESKNDYLDLRENLDLNLLQEFCFSSKDICKYCNHDMNTVFWSNNNSDLDEYIYNKK